MKKLFVPLMIIAMLALTVSPVLAAGIRIDPHGSYYGLAVMQESPATFHVYLQTGDSYDPHIFLVMPESTYDDLTTPVTVEWPGGPGPVTVSAPWTQETDNSVKVPPGCASGSDYTVAALKDHLQTSEPIRWAFVSFLEGPIPDSPGSEFTVTMTSAVSDPRMVVYVLAKAEGGGLFSNSVPPTQPGFVVPELATVLMAAASFSALGVYALKRKRN